MAIKAVLFDMDGVLIDSEEIILRAAIEGLKQFGVYAKEDDFTEFVGAGETKYLGGPAAKYGVEFDPEMKVVTYAIYADLLKEAPDAVYNGVLETLNKVKENYLVSVCSAADLIKVEHNLNAIGVTPAFFNAFVTGSDVTRQKPFPDIFLAAAEKLGIDPSECLVIEDSLNGIRAAKAAGMTSVAVPTSFAPEVLKTEVSPDYIIDKISDLPDLLAKI